jgi:outer membrane lipoprotein-sorting protein
MNTPNQPKSDMLDRAIEALRTVPTLDRPPSSCVASTLAALSSQPISPVPSLNQQRRQRMFRIARYSGLAAALILLAFGVGVIWLFDRGAAPVFAQVVDNVNKATSVSCTVKTRMGSRPTFELKYYMQGRLMRMELPGKQEAFDAKIPFTTVAVFDVDKKTITYIDYNARTFRSENKNVDEALTKQFSSPVEWFSRITEKDAKRIGEEELNGHKTYLYQLLRINLGDKDRALEEGETAKAWVDAQSNLPVKIVLEVNGVASDRKEKSFLTAENFVWNQPLESALFKLEVPKGFKVINGKSSNSESAK